MRAGPDPQVKIGRGNFQTVKKDPRHPVVIMLASMHQNFLVPFAQFPTQSGSFDELRARPHNAAYFQSRPGFHCLTLKASSFAHIETYMLNEITRSIRD